MVTEPSVTGNPTQIPIDTISRCRRFPSSCNECTFREPGRSAELPYTHATARRAEDSGPRPRTGPGDKIQERRAHASVPSSVVPRRHRQRLERLAVGASALPPPAGKAPKGAPSLRTPTEGAAAETQHPAPTPHRPPL